MKIPFDDLKYGYSCLSKLQKAGPKSEGMKAHLFNPLNSSVLVHHILRFFRLRIGWDFGILHALIRFLRIWFVFDDSMILNISYLTKLEL